MIYMQGAPFIVSPLSSVTQREGNGKKSDINQSSYQEREIPLGCADIAQGLGLKPEDTVWDFDWVTPCKNGNNKDGLQEYQSVMTLIRGGATGLTLKLPEGFLDYLQRYTGVTRVLEVTDSLPSASGNLSYPDHSIVIQAVEKARKEPHIHSNLHSKTYCACLPVVDVQDTVKHLSGQTLISAQQTKYFNSKARVATQAASNGYIFSPHVVISRKSDLADGLNQIKSIANQIGMDANNTKFWIKFDNMAGGDGVFPYHSGKMSFDDIDAWVTATIKDAGYPEEELFPVVIDIDIGALPGVRSILGNFNVQAIVGAPGVTITGTTMQNTKDGVYLGGRMPQTPLEERLAHDAKFWAAPVLNAAREQGYQGYAGIDVMMVEGIDGENKGYIIEMNGRLNSSTSLLSMVQWARQEAQEKTPFAASNIVTSFSPLGDFHSFQREYESVLFKGRDSGYSGIVPVYFDFNKESGIYGAKFIAVAPDVRALGKLEERCAHINNIPRPI